ncbi:ABC transporter ATP-binding protein [Oceanirhabdus sp. W0125-5]|uniref:ABC transporter ATP-binding protein n=1 Tax=Oceanirhabdus sp. W0125-5 TaxID=2999116 RepID=UPI0022F341BA|nr:ABC transporter ATP-binding protein [Oceanirhabdus sp. W0125-5]WBW98931.1 ABC transporter ATP-binding protein [Oceanirhabdus sp. W0125-5]
MSMIEVKGLIKKFKDVTALDCVDFSVEEGEIIGLLGPNGAGKSTFINILCGLISRDKGEVKIFGKDINKEIRKIKRDIGVVPQDIAIYGDLTAYENVKFFASLYGIRGKKAHECVMEALKFVELDDKAKLKPSTFSGGMKRRLNIACAIAHSPKLIFMDEPTVGIDPQSRNHILQSVRKLNERGTTVVYTSHYMEEVEEVCGRIFILDHGKVIADGTKQELTTLITDYKEINISVGLIDEEVLKEMKNIKGIENVKLDDNVISITSDKNKDNMNEILDYLRTKKIGIRSIQMNEPNLETVFLSLTGRKLRDE